jgi:hypothetical protein
MSTQAFAWSDEQVSQRPSAQARDAFAWSDEETQPKGNAPGTISGNVSEMRAAKPEAEKPYRRFQGPFFERAASQFGEDLQDPRNVGGIPHGFKDWLRMGYDPVGSLIDTGRGLYESYKRDPAEAVGHLGVPALGALVMHGADAIPGPEVAPAPTPRVPIWKRGHLPEETPVPSVINRQPYAEVRPRVRPQPVAAEAPPAPIPAHQAVAGPYTTEGPPPAIPEIRPRSGPGSAEDIAETRGIQEQARERGEQEDRIRLSREKRDWFARNQPGATKAELTGAPEKPVRFTRTPGVGARAPKPGTVVPSPDEDLVPLLKKSLQQAKRKKG